MATQAFTAVRHSLSHVTLQHMHVHSQLEVFRPCSFIGSTLSSPVTQDGTRHWSFPIDILPAGLWLCSDSRVVDIVQTVSVSSRKFLLLARWQRYQMWSRGCYNSNLIILLSNIKLTISDRLHSTLSPLGGQSGESGGTDKIEREFFLTLRNLRD